MRGHASAAVLNCRHTVCCNTCKPWRTGAAGGLAGGPQRDEQLHERAPGVSQRAAGVGRCRAHRLVHWPGAPAARAGQRAAPAPARGALLTSSPYLDLSSRCWAAHKHQPGCTPGLLCRACSNRAAVRHLPSDKGRHAARALTHCFVMPCVPAVAKWCWVLVLVCQRTPGTAMKTCRGARLRGPSLLQTRGRAEPAPRGPGRALVQPGSVPPWRQRQRRRRGGRGGRRHAARAQRQRPGAAQRGRPARRAGGARGA